MPIDTSIYQLAGRGVKSVADYDNEYSQARQNKLQEMLGTAKMQDYQRGVERQNALRGVLGQTYTAPEERENALLRGGFLEEATKLGTDRRANAKSDVDTKKAQTELVDARLKQSRQFLDGVTTPEQYIAWHEGNHRDEVLGPMLAARGVTADKARASIAQALQKPGGLEELIAQSKLGVEKFAEMNKPQFVTTNLGGTSSTKAISGMTGEVRPIYSEAITQSPDSIANQATTRRGQDLKFQTDSGANTVAGQAVVGKRIQDVELKLQDDYRTESKGFAETSTAMKKVFGAIETADKNPGSALAAGTAFMKVLDPNSVVRETELGMALNASGWFDRAMNMANTLQHGRTMTAEQKKNLKAAAEDLFEEAKAAQREVDAAYQKRATDYGADPKRVIVDRGQNTTRQKPAQSSVRAEADKILGIK